MGKRLTSSAKADTNALVLGIAQFKSSHSSVVTRPTFPTKIYIALN
jgi:hypothetical protein